LLSALILGDPQREISMEGKEITFTKEFTGVNRFRVSSTRPRVVFTLILPMKPLEAVSQVYKHTNLMRAEDFRLPPPSWAFGYHIPLIRSNSEL